MYGIVITTKNEVRPVMLPNPTLNSMQDFVGGIIEVVTPVNLKPPYCMVVNENFLNLGLPLNVVGTFLYGGFTHGDIICGDILILKRGVNPDGDYDLVGLDPSELTALVSEYRNLISVLRKRMKGVFFK